ncbi:MAG: asparagine synthetase B, partial [Pirellulaceae bacterium]
HKLADVVHLGTPRDLYMHFLSHWGEPRDVVLGVDEGFTSLAEMTRPLKSQVENEMMYFDLVNYLPDDILVKVDRAAMSVSLETRVPFLDHRLVELAWRVPLEWKLRGTEGKWLLRQILYRHVPRELIERPKTGFGVPIAAWLRGPLSEWAEDLLDPVRLRREGYLNPDVIVSKWRQHRAGTRNWAYHLWDVLMFQSWLETR